MEEKFLVIKELDTLLRKWTGHQIKIIKTEKKDVDEINMMLDSISYNKDSDRPDNYEALYTLQLNGEGVIDTDVLSAEPLPEPEYEIDLGTKALYEYEDEEIIISTERAVYKIIQL